MFKVVKAIQYAKNYSAFAAPKEEEEKQIGDDVDPEILEKAYNYRYMQSYSVNSFSLLLISIVAVPATHFPSLQLSSTYSEGNTTSQSNCQSNS